MSKSVIIIDTPKCCAECNLCLYENDNAICYPEYIMKDLYVKNPFNPYESRMPECPLIPLEKVCKMAVEASREK